MALVPLPPQACGIAVCVALKGSEQDKQYVEKSIQLLKHRGPDGYKVLAINAYGPSIFIGHSRLAIVGNDDASQPLTWKKNHHHFHLVHNGEIYNYKDLRDQLIAEGDCKGDDFKTESDGEVLLASLANRGIEWTLQNIRGMFAFVIAETRVTEGIEHVDKVFLCRDAFGIKPLCYSFNGHQDKLFICSEVQAIPHDGFTDIQDVLPSSFISISFQLSKHSWSIREHKYEKDYYPSTPSKAQSNLSHNQQMSEIRSRLIDAVSTRIPKAVRFAVLLSGGLDSSLIARLAGRSPPTSFSLPKV